MGRCSLSPELLSFGRVMLRRHYNLGGSRYTSKGLLAEAMRILEKVTEINPMGKTQET